MTTKPTKIEELIAAGEKAANGDWSLIWEAGRGGIVAVWAEGRSITFWTAKQDHAEMKQQVNNSDFILQAANARTEIKEMYEENKRLRSIYPEGMVAKEAYNKVLEEKVEQQAQQITKLRAALIEALSIAQENVDDPDTVLIKHLKQTLAETKEDE